jgi:hypothetical protein
LNRCKDCERVLRDLLQGGFPPGRDRVELVYDVVYRVDVLRMRSGQRDNQQDGSEQ